MNPDSFRFFKHFLRAYPLRSALMVGLLALAGLAEGIGVASVIPVLEVAEGGQANSDLGRFIIGLVSGVGLEPTLPALLGLIVVAMTAKAVLLWFGMREVGYTVARVTRDLRLRLIRALFKARWGYFNRQTSGEFANTISSEAIRAAAAYRSACAVLAALFQVLAYVLISLLESWWITVFAIVSGSLLIVLLNGFVQASRAAGRAQTVLTKSLTGRLVDVVQGIKPIKAMNREELILPLLESETEGLNMAQRRQVLASETRRLFQQPVLTLLLAIALFFLLTVAEQSLASVVILAFIFYRLMQYVNEVQGRFQTMVVGESAFWSLNDQIEEAERESEALDGGRAVGAIRDRLELRDVVFAYEEGKPVLDHLSLVVPAGQFVALGGESGSGKTTLADVILGLHQPQEGSVFVDGEPLDELSVAMWRQQIGYVPQELLLFNGTIEDNITLGDETLSRADAEEALRLAEAWDFVRERPEGIETHVGEKGAMLSGGQRQRIAIARALVHRPSLLVLDEVTTALDPATEEAICETLRRLAGSVTIVSISHQPAMRRVADVAYVMKQGRLERVKDGIKAAV